MSRFNFEGDFFYQTNGSNWFVGTNIHLLQGQMPEYPFEEYRITDRQTLRNLNGDAVVYQNYNKAGYRFRWNYLDESKVEELKRMFDSNPYIAFFSNGVNTFGTLVMNGDPSISEVQFELYNVEIDLQEK